MDIDKYEGLNVICRGLTFYSKSNVRLESLIFHNSFLRVKSIRKQEMPVIFPCDKTNLLFME